MRKLRPSKLTDLPIINLKVMNGQISGIQISSLLLFPPKTYSVNSEQGIFPFSIKRWICSVSSFAFFLVLRVAEWPRIRFFRVRDKVKYFPPQIKNI